MNRTQAANMYRQRRHVSVEDTISLGGDNNGSPANARRHEFAQQVNILRACQSFEPDLDKAVILYIACNFVAGELIIQRKSIFASFLASDDFCHLLITFANSLAPDHDRHSVGPDLDLNCLTL